LFVALFVAGPLAEAALADEAANEALARRFYAAVNARNLDSLVEFVAANFIDHDIPSDALNGLAGLKLGTKMFMDSSSDLRIANDLVIAKGDYVTVLDTVTGTNDGPLANIPATHKPFTFHAIDVWLVRDGKLAEQWHVEEQLELMMQIGAIRGK
jgi:predicted ester cyclase